jgi:enamine deaminase RidA (YjgF/YER057c/UK114 family)
MGGVEMTPEEKIRDLGIELPGAPKPLGAYVPFVRTGNLVYLSGMLPLKDGKLLKTGRLGEGVSLEDGALCASTAALNALGVLRSFVGSLNMITQCVKLSGFVASAPDFTDQPKVLNGASELMVAVFGDSGRHARVAVGVNILPMNSPVEVDFIFEVRD